MVQGPHTHRRTPRQQRSRERLERLLATAERLMIERGYEHVSTNLIASAAGIPVGSIYHLFSNKEQILCALVARAFELYEAQIAAASTEAALALPYGAYYRRLLDAVERVWWKKRQLILLWHSMPYLIGLQDTVRKFIPRIEDLFVRWIEVNHPEVAARQRRAAGVMIKLAITGAMSEMLVRPAAQRRIVSAELSLMVIEYVKSLIGDRGAALSRRESAAVPRRRTGPRLRARRSRERAQGVAGD